MRLSIDGRTVRLKAHMCCLDGTLPGNTVRALRRCVAAGVEAMEIDVWAGRTAGFPVAHDEPRGGEPELAAMLAGLRGPGILQIDLKDEAPLPAHRLDALADLLRPCAPSLIVSGGSGANVRAVGERVHGLRLGYDPLLRFDLRRGRYVGALAQLHLDHEAVFDQLWADAPFASIWYLRATLLSRLADEGFDAVAWLAARGAEVDAWTIDVPDEPLLRRVAALGVAQVTTNTPLAWLTRPGRSG